MDGEERSPKEGERARPQARCVTKRFWFMFWRDTGAAERPSLSFFEASARFEDVVEGWREANLNWNRGRLLKRCSLYREKKNGANGILSAVR